QTPVVVVDTKALTVQVTVENDVPMTVGKVLWQGNVHVVASATAKMTNGLPLCLLGLDPKAAGTITLEKNAWLTAPGCLVNSNPTSPQGLKSMDNGVLTAGFICSAGGKVQSKNANYSPQPMTDCSPIPDPLAARQVPADAACSYTNKVVDGLTVTLQPGTYCGGLTVTNGALVTFADGIHVIKNGPFIVDNNASVTGAHVAFYLQGAGANLTFAATSTINLAAPKDGRLAGILIFDDPTGASAPEKPANHPKSGGSPRAHQILSDNARTLLGTIYMPQGRLIIDATKPIADRSAYTVLVVQQLDLYSGPNLVLNSDYGASEIPVPMGVGPYDGNVVLSN